MGASTSHIPAYVTLNPHVERHQWHPFGGSHTLIAFHKLRKSTWYRHEQDTPHALHGMHMHLKVAAGPTVSMCVQDG